MGQVVPLDIGGEDSRAHAVNLHETHAFHDRDYQDTDHQKDKDQDRTLVPVIFAKVSIKYLHVKNVDRLSSCGSRSTVNGQRFFRLRCARHGMGVNMRLNVGPFQLDIAFILYLSFPLFVYPVMATKALSISKGGQGDNDRRLATMEEINQGLTDSCISIKFLEPFIKVPEIFIGPF